MKRLPTLMVILQIAAFAPPNATADSPKESTLDRLNKATVDLMSPRDQRSKGKQGNSLARKEQIAGRIEVQHQLDEETMRSEKTVLSPQGGEFTVEYLSSCLWSGVRDIVVDGNHAYCAFVNGLVVFDISNPALPDSVGSFACIGNLGPAALFKQDHYVYLAARDSGLIVIDVQEPANPVRVGSFPGYCLDVHVQGSLAVFVDGSYLRCLDVSNPANPQLLGFRSISGWATNVFVNGDLALLSDWHYKVHVFDVSNPAQPESLAVYSAPDYVNQLFVRDTLAFVACYNAGLLILDISDPRNPDSVSSFSDSSRCPAYDVTVRDSLAYVADYCGMIVINLSDPTNPTAVSHLYYSTALSISQEGNHAYVGDAFGGFAAIDVSDPANPFHAGSYEAASLITDVYVHDTLAFVSAGLEILDLGDPAAPELLATYRGGGHAFVVDTLLYLCSSGGIEIADISDPALPEYVGSVYTQGYAARVFVQDTLAYVAESGPGLLEIINVADPFDPWPIGSCYSPGTRGYDLFVKDTIAYVAAYDSGLQIVNVADPTNPQRIGAFDTSGYAYAVFIRDTLAYLSDAAGLGLITVNVADPTDPQFLGKGNFHSTPFDICVVGSLAFVADYSSGLKVADVSNPASPELVGSFDTPGWAQGVYARDSLVWVADQTSLIAFKVAYHPYDGPIWHVSTTGSDLTGDGSPEEPFGTIQHAIDMSSNGDTVMVDSGTYTGAGNRDIDFRGKRILVTGTGGPSATRIDCQGSLIESHGGFRFTSGEDSSALLTGFTVSRAGYQVDAITITNSSPTIMNCVFEHSGGGSFGTGALFTLNSSPSLVGCVFRENDSCMMDGVVYVDGGAPRLQNCAFLNNRNRVIFNSMSSSPVLTGCTFAGNGVTGAGTVIENYGSSTALANCIIAFNLTQSVNCWSDSPTISCSDIFGNTGGDWVSCIADLQEINGNFSLDPQFCDTASDNYYLNGTSPCAPANNSCGVLIGAYRDACGIDPNDPGVPDSVIVGVPIAVCQPFPDSIAIPVYLSNDEPACAFSFGFTYSSDHVEITSWSTDGSVIPPQSPFKMTQALPDQNQFLIGWFDLFGTYPIPPGRGLLGTLYMHTLPGANAITVDIDSTFVPVSGQWSLYIDTSAAASCQTMKIRPAYWDWGTEDIKLGNFLCGDMDGSGDVNLSDVVYLINYIFINGQTPIDKYCGDVDCSGDTNISDAVYMVSYIFAGGPPPCAGC